MTGGKRTTAQILREIATTERKLQRYKAFRKLLKTTIATVTAGIAAVAAGVINGQLLWAFIPTLLVSIGFLAWLTFDESYGGHWDFDESSKSNVFDYLTERLDELREELSTVGAE